MLINKIDHLADTLKREFDEAKVIMSEVTGQLDRVAADMRAGFDDVKGGVDKIAKSIQESLERVKNLQAPNYPYPHLVVVKEVETPQAKRGLLTKVRGLATKEMALHFLCPVDMSNVPCGVGGEGYRFRETRGWVKKISPVLQVRQGLL